MEEEDSVISLHNCKTLAATVNKKPRGGKAKGGTPPAAAAAAASVNNHGTGCHDNNNSNNVGNHVNQGNSFCRLFSLKWRRTDLSQFRSY